MLIILSNCSKILKILNPNKKIKWKAFYRQSYCKSVYIFALQTRFLAGIYQTQDQGVRYFPEFALNLQMLDTFLTYNNQMKNYLFQSNPLEAQTEGTHEKLKMESQIDGLSDKLKEIKQWYEESQRNQSLLPSDQSCFLEQKFFAIMKKDNKDQDQEDQEDDTSMTKKKIAQLRTKKITKCIHQNEKHYAKGLCKACYMKYGRQKIPTKCCHRNAVLYAKGMCHNCYMNIYLQEKSKQSSTSCSSGN